MEPLIIDGKRISKEIKDELKEKVAEYKSQGVEITLAVIQVGDDPASTVYVRNKKKACEYIGINSKSFGESGSRTFLNVVDYSKYLHRLDQYRDNSALTL